MFHLSHPDLACNSRRFANSVPLSRFETESTPPMALLVCCEVQWCLPTGGNGITIGSKPLWVLSEPLMGFAAPALAPTMPSDFVN